MKSFVREREDLGERDWSVKPFGESFCSDAIFASNLKGTRSISEYIDLLIIVKLLYFFLILRSFASFSVWLVWGEDTQIVFHHLKIPNRKCLDVSNETRPAQPLLNWGWEVPSPFDVPVHPGEHWVDMAEVLFWAPKSGSAKIPAIAGLQLEVKAGQKSITVISHNNHTCSTAEIWFFFFFKPMTYLFWSLKPWL